MNDVIYEVYLMLYRKLGRTGVDVGVIGMGLEHIWHESREYVDRIMNEAISCGINYFDLFMPTPEIRDKIGMAIRGKRDKVMFQGHIGCAAKEGEEYYRTRDLSICEDFVNQLLKRLRTDYIDVLILHFVDDDEDFKRVFESGGMLDLALRFKKEGKARFIGISSHRVSSSLKAVESGVIDVLMFPVNPAFDMLEGDAEIESAWNEEPYKELEGKNFKPSSARKELYMACERNGVAITAMKPYACGWLFDPNNPSSMVLTPHQCLSYALSQPGVCTVLPGCKTVEHIREAVSFLEASEEDKDYSSVISKTRWDFRGVCMYCRHCMPCPSGIDIAAVTRLADSAINGLSEDMKAKYDTLQSKASDCIQCGICMERCPFQVDVIRNMERAVKIYGK